MSSNHLLAEHERIRSTSYHPQGTFHAIPPDELDQSLLSRFATMVEIFPDHLAVQEGDRALTYRQLDSAANQVANALMALGGPEACAVALLFGMELEWIIATLAVWKAAKFWVALDLRHPEARLHAILDDAQAPFILTTERYRELASALSGTQRQWLTVEQALADASADEPAVEIGPETYAYLVYTSGSTGSPKGVIENHTNILHMIHERGELVHPSSADRIALLLPPAAGGAIYNIVLALWYGAALMLFEFVEQGVKRFEEWLLAETITGMHAGVVLRTWLPTLDGSRQFPALRFLLLGAAPVYSEHVTAFQRYLGGTCILVNPYSSAEVRAASLFAMDVNTNLSTQIIPVGFPPSWVTFEIWDENGQTLPSGATGEVVIFTQYMTPGYWRQPELTANVFGVDAAGRRYYRCGDVGRLDADGCLWILGRKDRQIKIRGYRVEPAEVEVELLNVAGVREAAVVVHGLRDDENYLAAYITLHPTCYLTVAELRQEIAARLPAYMVPRQITVMEKLPRNGYGKIDRPYLRSMPKLRQPGPDRQVEKLSMVLNLPTDAVEKCEETLSQQRNIGELRDHPTDDYVPFTPTEIEQTLVHRWQRMVALYGPNLALEEAERTLTYTETNILANRIAHAILARRSSNAVPIGLIFDVECDLPMSILAVWKAGKFFTWLEPRQPLTRNQYMVAESGATLVVTNRKHEMLTRQLMSGASDIIVIEDLAEELPTDNPPVTSEASHPAYLIYTSGSTGQPKGTVELHGHLVHFMVDRQTLFQVSPHDRVAFLLFGVGFVVPMSALMYGGCLLPFQIKHEGLSRFSHWLIERRMTLIIGGADLRTWLLSLNGSQQFPDLRLLALCAGPSYLEHVQAFQRYLPEDCRFINVYSATETRFGTLWMLDRNSQVESRLIPAGYPTRQAAIEIWDEKGLPHRVGATGEIVIFSPYVAAGYWKSPELTASRFGMDGQERRFYRTGDLGRLDGDGCLWVLGRMDGQFKIRGNRVEIAEIEVALLELANVHEAAVIHFGDTDEDRVIMAFVASNALITGIELRKQLAAHLPDYMVPTMIVVLDELPHNANGKIDRPALKTLPITRQQNVGHTVKISTSIPDLPRSSMTITDNSYPHHAQTHLVQSSEQSSEHRHPTGEHIPITLADIELSPLHRWQHMVDRCGTNAALEEGDRIVTYAKFNTLVNRIAHAILARNVPNDLPVALLFSIESDLHIGIFSIWKAGNFFVWLEPDQPIARNQYIVEDSSAPLVVTNRHHAELAHRLWPDAGNVIVIEELADDLPTYNPPLTLVGSDPAYLMYTSGSTGKPKGTVELHRNLLAAMVDRQAAFHFSTHDRVGNLSLASGWTFQAFGALLYGGCLLPFRAKEEGLTRFCQWLIGRRVTIAISGAILRTWLPTLDGSLHFPDLRAIICGAGPLYLEHWQAYHRYLSDDCVMVNAYAATECRSGTIYVMDKSSHFTTRLMPVGFTAPHVAVEIWDDKDKPVPVGESGEIVIFTAYAAAGYWKSPELTMSRFGVDAQGRRYYRMGDLGRLDEDGCLWVLGRMDGQLKIRGNRVEIAEVEVALLELPTVQEAVVIHRGETEEEIMLVGFVVAAAAISGVELRKQLASFLPDYMVPSTLVVVEELPRNANGKVARPLLCEMAKAFTNASHEKSRATETLFRTQTETRVAEMMRELLAVSSVGPNDNFFEMGGHSLLSTRLLLQIHRNFGIDLLPRDFLANPTAVALAQSIDQALLSQQPLPLPVRQASMLRIEAMQVVSGSPTHTPIFLCLGGNGSQIVLLRYQKLIRRLGQQWPLYAFVTPETDDPNGLYESMEDLVGETLVALRQVQPHGPYFLIGECQGGKLAFELARALAQDDEQIGLLTLLDAPLLSKHLDNFALKTWQERFAYHKQEMTSLGWQRGVRYLLSRLGERLRNSIDPSPTESKSHLVQERYSKLLAKFEPSQLFGQPATAIYTRENQPHLSTWTTLIPDLEVTMVDGTHQEYMQLYGDEVVATLDKALDTARKNISVPAPR